MTVAIPEVAGTAVAADTGAAGASRARASRAPARQSRPTDAQMGRGPRGAPGPPGGRGPTGATTTTPSGPPASQRQPRQRQQGSKSRDRKRGNEFARRVTGAATRPGSELHNYQAIIAAEFVAASLLVALTPIASRKAQPSAVSGKLSPYVPGDLMQLVAIGIVYLILEGMAAGPRGLARFSAWFGLLLLLGVGLFEASRLGDLFKMLTGGGVSTIVLTGAAAPATKGESPVPPLTPGQAASTTPPPKTGA